MGTLTRNCPHCGTKLIGFSTFAAIKKGSTDRWLTALECNGCHGGYMVEVRNQISESPHNHDGDIESYQYFHCTDEYPRKVERNIPEHLPNNIKHFYAQAISALKADNYDSSAMMSRKVLEVSTKRIHPEGRGSLYQRIETLQKEGRITEDLKEWAHIIREDGNESAHEEEPVSREFSEEILSFTELFLLYVFTMPGMVAARKPETAEATSAEV